MNIPILTKPELRAINIRNQRYPLAVAEKDYFLTLVSKIIYDSPLKDRLVFKGGTALHHCYLPQMRFSEDLDFTATDKTVLVEDVRRVLEQYDFLTIKKEYVSTATIKMEKVQYLGPLGLPNSLKVEIDYLQGVVLPPQDLPYMNVWGIDTKVRVMDVHEICAEKIRATSDRARHRDFYDLYMLLQKHSIALPKVLDLVQKKEIRKPISKEKMLDNLDLTQEDREQEMGIVRYTKGVEYSKLQEVIDRLPFDVIQRVS